MGSKFDSSPLESEGLDPREIEAWHKVRPIAVAFILMLVGVCAGLLGSWLFSDSGYQVQAVEITVERGDTMFAIADRYKVDRSFLLDLNDGHLGYNLKVCSADELKRSYNEGGREQYTCRNAMWEERKMTKFNTLFPGQTVLVPLGNWENAQDRHDARGTILTVMLNERPPNY